MNSAMLFDAGALLDEYFELRSYAGDSAENWSEKVFKNNPPRLYRYQRLRALLRAFDLPLAAAELERGTFLLGREPDAYQFLHDELMALHGQGVLANAPRQTSGLGYRMLYQSFVQLLYEQYRLLHFNSGWVEASSAEAQYIVLVSRGFVNSYDHEQLAAIKQTVRRLLDPKQRQFSLGELITRFGFPDVDLLDVDIEWM